MQLRLRLHSGDAFVHPQALVFFFYIVGRNADVETKVELYLRDFNAGLAFHFAYGAFQHLRIKFESHRFDVSALLSTQKISSAPQFEIKRSYLEARAEIGEFLECGETAAGKRRQLDFRGQKQISIGAPVRAAHPSA